MNMDANYSRISKILDEIYNAIPNTDDIREYLTEWKASRQAFAVDIEGAVAKNERRETLFDLYAGCKEKLEKARGIVEVMQERGKGDGEAVAKMAQHVIDMSKLCEQMMAESAELSAGIDTDKEIRQAKLEIAEADKIIAFYSMLVELADKIDNGFRKAKEDRIKPHLRDIRRLLVTMSASEKINSSNTLDVSQESMCRALVEIEKFKTRMSEFAANLKVFT